MVALNSSTLGLSPADVYGEVRANGVMVNELLVLEDLVSDPLGILDVPSVRPLGRVL